MPELPEVETIRRTLQKLVIGKEIENVTVSLPRIIQRPKVISQFQERLVGTRILEIRRRGKFLIFDVDPWVLVSHLRMEGKYSLQRQEDPHSKYTHVIFHFTDGTELRYQDMRQFGTMHLFAKGEEEKYKPLNTLGPEPLSDHFQLSWFRETLRKRKASLKALLLNQEYLVGLGNIYVDESLFSAGLHPTRSPSSLTDEEVERLYYAIKRTLTEAIQAGGSSVRSYVNGRGEMGRFQLQIQVYGRKNQPCVKCGTEIERIVVAGRGTYFCQHCQRVQN